MSDFTNINDPAGVKALLDTLRKSQAWQDLDAQNDTCHSDESKIGKASDNASQVTNGIESSSTVVESSEKVSESPSDIMSLLACLQSAAPTSAVVPHVHSTKQYEVANTASHVVNPPKKITGILKHSSVPAYHEEPSRMSSAQPSTSVRNMSFSQALPVIANLASDVSVRQKLRKIREQQNSLEKQLFEERNRIFKSQEEKVRVYQTKAAIIGAEISEQELKNLQTSFVDEMKKFDLERALKAWDCLVTSQQRTLEELGIPGMFVTTDKSEREKQQRIIQVLDGLASPDDSVDNGIDGPDEAP